MQGAVLEEVSSMQKQKYRTVVAIKTIPSRPYKIYVEVRRMDARGKYALTLVSKDEKKIDRLYGVLARKGYKATVHNDLYGFARLHLRSLSYNDVSYILVMLKYWIRSDREEEETSRALEVN